MFVFLVSIFRLFSHCLITALTFQLSQNTLPIITIKDNPPHLSKPNQTQPRHYHRHPFSHPSVTLSKSLHPLPSNFHHILKFQRCWNFHFPSFNNSVCFVPLEYLWFLGFISELVEIFFRFSSFWIFVFSFLVQFGAGCWEFWWCCLSVGSNYS